MTLDGQSKHSSCPVCKGPTYRDQAGIVRCHRTRRPVSRYMPKKVRL